MLVRLLVATVLLAQLGFASALVIVRAPEPYMRQLATRFRLTIQKKIRGHNIFLVQGPAGVTPEQIVRDLQNWDYGKDPGDSDNDDDDDVRAEPAISVTLAETGPGVPRLVGDTTAVTNALRDQRTVNFHGQQAWRGYAQQPGLSRLRIADTLRSFGSGGTVVAVIDTGIDADHPLLRNHLVVGFDFIKDVAGHPSELEDLDPETRSILSPYTTAILDTVADTNPYTTAILDQSTATRLDPSRIPTHFGHGTMVSGIVRLVAPGARIMPLKPFGADGRASLFNLLQAIYYAVDNGAKVINMSLSLAAHSDELQFAIDYAASKGVIPVASVGNSGLEVTTYPAGYQQVIGVASVNSLDRRSVFSNFGDNVVTLSAPGEAVITLFPGGRYAAGWGTSFSAPLVSGTISVMTRLRPWINWEFAEAGVKEAAPTESGLGSGRLDVFRAVRKASEF
jgi:subtilisin family serine protease